MFRIDTATAVAVLPAPDAPGAPGFFTKGNPGPGTPVPATNFSQDWCNSVQEELVAIAIADGAALSKADNAQVLAAIRKLIQKQTTNYATTTGGPAAYAVTLNPVPANVAALIGAPIRIRINVSNSGACSLNINGLGALPMVRGVTTNLGPGDLAAGCIYTVVYNPTTATLEVLELLPLQQQGAGPWPDVNVPNTGVATAIAVLGAFVNNGQAAFRISFDDGAGAAYQTGVNAFQFGNAAKFGENVVGSTGTVSFSLSGTTLMMTRTGGPANAAVHVLQLWA